MDIIKTKTGMARMVCTSAAALVLGLSTPASAGADVSELEAKLEKAMALIEAQSKQLDRVSGELSKLKSRKSSVVTASGATIPADLEDRLLDLEDTIFELDEKVGSRAVVNAFDAQSFDIGGFLHTTFSYVDGDNGSASAFDTQNFELLIKAQLDDQWSAFFAGGFLREENNLSPFSDPAIAGSSPSNPQFNIVNRNPQIIGWINYKHNDQFNIQLGRMITPHGIINIEHFPQVLLDPRQPQFLRPFGGDTIFPNFVTGAQAHGKFFIEGSQDFVQYNAYAAAAQSDPEDMLYGGRLAYSHGESGVTVGVNALHGDRGGAGSQPYTVVGADLLIDKGWLLWKNEFFSSSEDEAGLNDRLGWYTQPAWRINDKWTTFYRYDFLDDGNDGNGGDSIENVLGLTFKPKPSVHIRLTGTHTEFQDGGTIATDLEAYTYQFSTTLSF